MAKSHQCQKCRKFVVFPICVRGYEEDISESGIVFPKMIGYHIGYHEEENLRLLYFVQLRTAIECIHQAGVVHLDLFPSNIMWKVDEQNDGIVLKIIDWDSAHFIHNPAVKTLQVLEECNHLLARFSMLGQESNPIAYDWVYYKLMEVHIHNPEFCKRDKLSLDREFIRIRYEI
jgi:serine/threonine protein kinase